MEIFKQTAREQGEDDSDVRGTCVSLSLSLCKKISVNVQQRMPVQLPGRRLILHMKTAHLLIKSKC
jgi:hypothetical protein